MKTMTGYFRVQLALQTLSGGRATLDVPLALRALPHDFVLVNSGGAEAIVRVEQPESVLKALAHETNCTKLTPKQLEETRAGYAAPSLKRRYRPVDASQPSKGYTNDKQGHPIVETVQTVRSGIYLIDVPVVEN
jgi:hypothetical protein